MGFRLFLPCLLLILWSHPSPAQYYYYYGYNYSSINWGYFYGSQIVNNAVQGAQISMLNASVNQLQQQNLATMKQMEKIYREIDELEKRADSFEAFQDSVARYTKYRASLIQQEVDIIQKQRQELFLKTENGENKRPGPDFFFWVEDYATKIDRLDQSIMQRRGEIDLLSSIRPPDPAVRTPSRASGPVTIELGTSGAWGFGIVGVDFYDGAKKIGPFPDSGGPLVYRRSAGAVNLTFQPVLGPRSPVASFFAEPGRRYRLERNVWNGMWTVQESSTPPSSKPVTGRGLASSSATASSKGQTTSSSPPASSNRRKSKVSKMMQMPSWSAPTAFEDAVDDDDKF